MSGFSPQTLTFLGDLAGNNTREWFAANRKAYEQAVKNPAAWFVDAVVSELAAQTGKQWSGRIFRINRDVRFSKDKTPYNTHVHIGFQPEGTTRGGPALMFGLEPGSLVLGAGAMSFSPDALSRWRKAMDGAGGEAMSDILMRLEEDGARLGDIELKRVPAPYAADHPRAALLRRKSLTAWRDMGDLSMAFGNGGPSRCVTEYARFQPLMDALEGLSG
jgi:uncharacterized protein (TIGR02453 family)